MTDEEFAELALVIAYDAGELLISGWRDVKPVATKSTKHDLVTQMDGASEKLVRQKIASARPEDVVLGEEEGQQGALSSSGVRWVVDPLDGTVNYFYGHPAWAVSIAVEREGDIVAGVVCIPALHETYLAWRGGGAWSINSTGRERLQVSGVDDLTDAVVGTGFGYDSARRGRQGRVVAELLPTVRDVRRIGAAAPDLCWVAQGRLDAHYECGLNYWDWAAGALMVTEAGGVVRDLDGGPGRTEMTIAGPVSLATQLAERLDQLGARDCL